MLKDKYTKDNFPTIEEVKKMSLEEFKQAVFDWSMASLDFEGKEERIIAAIREFEPDIEGLWEEHNLGAAVYNIYMYA